MANGLINYGIVKPELATSFAQGFQEAQSEGLRKRAAEQQLKSQETTMQFNQEKLAQLRQDREQMLKLQQQLSQAGQNPDLDFVFDTMIKSGIPDYMIKGLEGKRKLDEQKQFSRIMGFDTGAPSAAAPAAPNALVGAVPPPPPAAAGEGFTPMPAAPAPAVATPMAAPATGASRNATAQKINQLIALGTPAAIQAANALASQLKLEEKPPTSIQEFEYGAKNPAFREYQFGLKAAGAPKTVLPEQEKSFEKGLGEVQAKGIAESKTGAEDARQIIDTVNIGRSLLDKGAITGFGANFLVNMNSALKQAGIDFGYADAAANSQAYMATLGNNVGRIIKLFGAGTGLSDADREYAAQIAGGKIELNEKALRRILDINEKASRNVIALHNKKVKSIKTNIPLTVEMPLRSNIPQAAADLLKQNPSLRKDFDAKYGKGAAAEVLGD